jgi:hypothetical protein
MRPEKKPGQKPEHHSCIALKGLKYLEICRKIKHRERRKAEDNTAPGKLTSFATEVSIVDQKYSSGQPSSLFL